MVRRGSLGTLYSDNGKEARMEGSNNENVKSLETDLMNAMSKIE